MARPSTGPCEWPGQVPALCSQQHLCSSPLCGGPRSVLNSLISQEGSFSWLWEFAKRKCEKTCWCLSWAKGACIWSDICNTFTNVHWTTDQKHSAEKFRKAPKVKLEFAALRQLLHSITGHQEVSMQKDVGLCVICKCYAISYHRLEHPQRWTTSRWRSPGTNPQRKPRANLANSIGEKHRAPHLPAGLPALVLVTECFHPELTLLFPVIDGLLVHQRWNNSPFSRTFLFPLAT